MGFRSALLLPMFAMRLLINKWIVYVYKYCFYNLANNLTAMGFRSALLSPMFAMRLLINCNNLQPNYCMTIPMPKRNQIAIIYFNLLIVRFLNKYCRSIFKTNTTEYR